MFLFGRVDVLDEGDVLKVCKFTSGDVIYVPDGDNIVKVGERYKNYHAIVSVVNYTQKKWWQFWKPKKQIGYFVRWF